MKGAVIFDLDGVLIDSEGLQYRAYVQVLARFGVHVSLSEYARFWIAAGRGPQHAVDHYRLPISAAELRELKNPVYHELLRREVTLMPGAVPVLERLGARYPLAIATNSNRADVGFVIDHFDLAGRFAAVVAREDYPRAKPEPDAFLAAAARLGVAPSRCVVVEDAYKGIIAAVRAGARVIAVPNDYTRDNDFSRADRIAGSLDGVTVAAVEELLHCGSVSSAGD